MDLIEHDAFKNIIILQTVLEELRHKSNSIYNRARSLIADPSRKFYVFSNEFHRYAISLGSFSFNLLHV
jgi:exosome complex exonuclease DIS3/RRP44